MDNTINSLTIEEKGIVKSLLEINLIVSYPIDLEVLVKWTKVITRLRPNAKPEHINKLMGRFYNGEIEFRPNIGILNITKNFDKVGLLELDENGKPKFKVVI